MTEEEFHACPDPQAMLAYLLGTVEAAGRQGAPRPVRVSGRKLRLFAAACYDRLRIVGPHHLASTTLDFARQFADGELSPGAMDCASEAARRAVANVEHWFWALPPAERAGVVPVFGTLCLAAQVLRPDHGLAACYTSRLASWLAGAAASAGGLPLNPAFSRAEAAEKHVQARLLVDLVGPAPFRPVRFAPEWRTSTVVALARGIYNDRAFDRLPLLMDALMDEGCSDEHILTHCRSPGPHCRGCWVVDLVLGKE